jgi:hypothetical protein
MAKRRASRRAKLKLEKVGISLTRQTEYRMRILAAKLQITPSMLVEQLLTERFRGEDLPALPRAEGEVEREAASAA